MQVKIDFRLSRQFGVVEKIIFRLVLNGICDAGEITKTISLFSDSVIANGIKNLVNHQILAAEFETRRLTLSEPVIAIINMAMEKTFAVTVTSDIEKCIKEGMTIDGSDNKEVDLVKKVILNELLPGIKLDMYIDSFDFILREARG